jgi:hypothetical protein
MPGLQFPTDRQMGMAIGGEPVPSRVFRKWKKLANQGTPPIRHLVKFFSARPRLRPPLEEDHP